MPEKEKSQIAIALEAWERLIAEGETAQALSAITNEQVLNRLKSRNGKIFRKQLVNLSSRYNGLEEKRLLNTVDQDRYDLTMSRINHDLLSILNDEKFQEAIGGQQDESGEVQTGLTRVAILLGVVGIALLLGLWWWFSSAKVDCTQENRIGLYIADFVSDGGEDSFSTRVSEGLDNKVGNAVYGLKRTGYIPQKEAGVAISQLFENSCDTSGIVVYGFLENRAGTDLLNCYINLENFKLKVKQLSVGDTVIALHSPSSIDFDIDINSIFVVDFVFALTKAFEGEGEAVIQLLKELKEQPFVQEQQSDDLNGAIDFYLACAYTLNNQPVEAIAHFDTAQALVPKLNINVADNQAIARATFVEALSKPEGRVKYSEYVQTHLASMPSLLKDFYQDKQDTSNQLFVEVLTKLVGTPSFKAISNKDPERIINVFAELSDTTEEKQITKEFIKETLVLPVLREQAIEILSPDPRIAAQLGISTAEKDSIINPIAETPPFPYNTKVFNGLTWMTENLNTKVADSWCYREDPKNCATYGRLYTWEAAKKACKSLGNGWRLPTDEEWQGLAKSFGGYYYFERKENIGEPQKAYTALMEGGRSGLSAQLGGARFSNGSFEHLGDGGGYWSATDNDSDGAWYYYFYRDNRELNRVSNNKADGRSCRCVQGAPSNGND